MVKSIFSLMTSRQNTILSGAFILMVMVMASKILGLVRDRLLAHIFAPDDVAVFLGAFILPDTLFQLLIVGAISVGFITIFTETVQRKGEAEAFKFASETLNALLLSFSFFCIVAFILARPAMELIVPGFTSGEKDVTGHLTQIILLGQILLAIGSFFASISQSFQRFLIPSLAAVLYNTGIILGIIFLAPIWGIYGPAFGVIIGAALHVIIQLPLMSSLGFKFKPNIWFGSEGLKEVVKMMSMRNIGLAVDQINEIISKNLASLISTSSLTYLTFAQHLHAVPIGLFGATLAQAAMPVLVRENTQNGEEMFKRTLFTTMHQILFLALPSAAILIVLRIPTVRLVFGASQFDWEATVLTGRTVALLAVGLAAQSISLLLVRGFYALKDTKTPVIVSVITVNINIILSLIFVKTLHLDVWSLGLSYAIASNISLIILLFFLSRKIGGFNRTSVINPAAKMLSAAIVAAVALYIPIKALDQLVFDTTRTVNLLLLTGIASIFGLSIYLLLVWLMKVPELNTYVQLLKRIYNLQFKLKAKEVVDDTGNIQ